MKAALIIAVALAAISANAELKIKFTTTVDVVEDGKVIGQRKLRPGTVVEVVEAEEDVKDTKKGAAKTPARKKLVPSNVAPMMFLNTKKAGTVLRAEVRLSDCYYGFFDGKENEYWSIDLNFYNKDGEYACSARGYVLKDSDVGRRLVKLVEDGSEHKVLVKLSHPKGEDGNGFIIDDFDEVKD